MFANNYFFQERYRKSLLKKVTDNSLANYIQAPLVKKNTKIQDIEFLSLDFETTGLDSDADAILSIGCTVIKNLRILLKENFHQIIKVNKPLPKASVVIHKITDDRANQGEHLHIVMTQLLQKMQGRVLLVHFADIEQNFLNMACEKLYGVKLPMLVVDTMKIEQKRLTNKNSLLLPSQLRLFNIRADYGLPRYYAHDALEDAIATAELFLAQVTKLELTKLKSIL